MINNNNLNVFKSHDLIKRSQTYVLDRKLVSFHSNDRDINKWPYANDFEIELPETLHNIQSFRVMQTAFPMKLYTFSNEYQNVKMTFRLIANIRTGISEQVYIVLSQNSNHNYTIEIQEGTYTEEQLCNELQNKMNYAVKEFLLENNISESEADYNYFYATYDSVAQKIWFGNSYDGFTLEFQKKESYDLPADCRQPDVWSQYTHYGLPYYLGYEKKQYPGYKLKEPITFDYNEDPIWFTSDNSNGVVYVVEAPFICNLYGDSVMYMMIDKYNSMDEIVPYSTATSNLYNNDYNGTVNAAFEKISLNILGSDQIFNGAGDYLFNVSNYDVPIENIRKLRFRFRFHDGRLVDFKNSNFNFTIGFNCIKDEIPRDYDLRIPASFG